MPRFAVAPVAAGVSVVCWWLLGGMSMAEGPRRPNVLLIISDDLRPQLGCYGDAIAKTPHLDAFSQQALRFDRAFVQSAVCSPSRNSMLSGLRPNTTGLRGFGVRVRERVPDIVTLPQHFKRHGYHTKGIGKVFHLYDESMLGSEDDPESWSEPLQLPKVPVWGPVQNALRDRLIKEAMASGREFRHPHDWPRARTWDDSDVPDDAMQDGETASLAIEFLRGWRGREQPFFLAVGFLRPHLPFNAPKKYWDLYDLERMKLPTFRRIPDGAPQWTVNRGIVQNYFEMPTFDSIDETFLRRYLQAYLACISYVDACTGRVLQELQRSRHAEDTIVVFVGDHGYQMGEYDSWGHKHSNFDISTRIPLLIAKPGMRSAGGSTRALTELLDLYPSLCDSAGLPIPSHCEGKSFASLLDDATGEHRDAAFSEMVRQGKIGRSLRNNDFRFTQWRNADGRLVAEELYDHREGVTPQDPSIAYNGELEVANVIDDREHAEIVARLRQRLTEVLPHRIDVNQD